MYWCVEQIFSLLWISEVCFSFQVWSFMCYLHHFLWPCIFYNHTVPSICIYFILINVRLLVRAQVMFWFMLNFSLNTHCALFFLLYVLVSLHLCNISLVSKTWSVILILEKCYLHLFLFFCYVSLTISWIHIYIIGSLYTILPLSSYI